MSNYFLGNLSIHYFPSVSFLTTIAAVVVAMMVFTRWRRGELPHVLDLPRQAWLGISALGFFFLLGYLRAVWQVSSIETVEVDNRLMPTLFRISLRDNNLLGHYMFLGHWLTFLIMGWLAVVTYREFRTLLLSFSILFIVQLLSIPFSFYPKFLYAIFVECESLGLGFAQVNRAYIGYLAALCAAFTLTLSHEGSRPRTAILLAWWAVLSSVVFLSGSRGPVLAWFLASAFVIWRQWSVANRVYMLLQASLMGIFVVSLIFNVSLLPCGSVKKFEESRYSFEARLAHIQDLLAPYIGRHTTSLVSLPSGEKIRMNAGDLVRYEAGEDAFMHQERMYISLTHGYSQTGLTSWLIGNGFGGSQRSIDVKGNQLRTHAGTQNLLVDLFIDTGIVGLMLFILSQAILINILNKASIEQDTRDNRLLTTGLGSIALVLFVKTSIASDTPSEDLVSVGIGLLIGSLVIATAGNSRGTLRNDTLNRNG